MVFPLNLHYQLLDKHSLKQSFQCFQLRLWMDENVTLDQGLGKSWEGKIVVIGEASDGMPLNEAILADNKVVEPLTVPGSEVSAYTLDDTESETSSVSSAYQAYYVTYGTG